MWIKSNMKAAKVQLNRKNKSNDAEQVQVSFLGLLHPDILCLGKIVTGLLYLIM